MEEGAPKSYGLAIKAMDEWGKHRAFSINDVFLVGSNDPRLAILKDVPPIDPSSPEAPLEFSHTVLGRQYVEGAYVYLNALPQTSARSGSGTAS